MKYMLCLAFMLFATTRPSVAQVTQANIDKLAGDTRNTLLWQPMVVTDKNGEATIEFFCSDVARQFIGIAEGVTGDGVLGSSKFSFRVK